MGNSSGWDDKYSDDKIAATAAQIAAAADARQGGSSKPGR